MIYKRKTFTKRKDDPMDRLILYKGLIPIVVITAFSIISTSSEENICTGVKCCFGGVL